MTIDRDYADLIETLGKPGCAICQLLLRDAQRFIDTILYEYVMDHEIHNAFRAGRGLCNTHAWQMQQGKGNALVIAVFFHAALDEVLKMNIKPDSGGSSGLASLLGRNSGNDPAQILEPTGPCLVCQHLDEAETRYFRILTGNFRKADLRDAFKESGGLCLPHVRQALGKFRRNDAETFLKLQRDIWQSLHGELELFMRRYDIQHADEAIGAEGDSWRRAIRYLTGEAGVFGLRRDVK
jgi:hypothetical protein